MKTALILMLAPLAAFAGSPFDGKWKMDYTTQRVLQAYESGWEVRNGTYKCTKNCQDRIGEVKADGEPHPIKNHAATNQLTVDASSPTVIKRSYAQGTKPLYVVVDELSADGQSLAETVTDYTGTQPIEQRTEMRRIGAPDPATHKTSGVWAWDDKPSSGTDVTQIVTVTATGIRVDSNGQVTEGKFDGKEYPTGGDPTHTMNIFKRTGERSLEWTSERPGSSGTEVWVVAPDGKALTDTYTSAIEGYKLSVVWRKQL